MNRTELMERVKALPFPREDYWVITGGAMVLYGLREQTHDIDLGCTSRLADELERQGAQVSIRKDGTRKLVLEGDIEIMENWLYDRVDEVDGVPVISLAGLKEMKQSLGREKDMKDIALIDAYLASRG
ncbi:MAG: hypothetical protein IKK21_03700 [Clostridia bacterium]|nr:hypothetical protein [Clostridia bacterium]